MSTPDSEIIVTPFNLLPSEKEGYPDPKKIEEEKQFIRKYILDRPNIELVNDEGAEQGEDKVCGCRSDVDAKLLLRLGDTHGLQCGDQEGADDASAVPRLENGVQDQYCLLFIVTSLFAQYVSYSAKQPGYECRCFSVAVSLHTVIVAFTD